MTGVQTQLWRTWRQVGRPCYPDPQQEADMKFLLGCYWMAAPHYEDPRVQWADRYGFLNELWDAITGGAPMEKQRLRVLLTHPDKTAREWGIRLAGAGK